jgi:hypothetical protein
LVLVNDSRIQRRSSRGRQAPPPWQGPMTKTTRRRYYCCCCEANPQGWGVQTLTQQQR